MSQTVAVTSLALAGSGGSAALVPSLLAVAAVGLCVAGDSTSLWASMSVGETWGCGPLVHVSVPQNRVCLSQEMSVHLYDSILPTTGWKHLIPVNVASLFHVWPPACGSCGEEYVKIKAESEASFRSGSADPHSFLLQQLESAAQPPCMLWLVTRPCAISCHW